MYAEEKISDGIYITKPIKTDKQNLELKNNLEINKLLNSEFKENTVIKNDNDEKYLCKSNGQLIDIYEIDFNQLEYEVKNMYKANEEMQEYDPEDYDLIEARQENLEIIFKKLNRMKEIQAELNLLCPSNPICGVNIFDSFSDKIDEKKKGKVVEESEENNKNDEIKEQNSNITHEIDL